MGAAGSALVREMYELFNAGEYARATEILPADVELHQDGTLPDADVYVGRDEFTRGLARWLDGFEPGFQFAIEELVEGDGALFMRVRLRGRGRGSGAALERPIYHVWELREGRPHRLRVASDERAARAAAGLAG